MNSTALTRDPQLIGQWQDEEGLRWVYEPLGALFCGVLDIPYELQDEGQTLVINGKSRYTRQSDDVVETLVGHWRDEDAGEELHFKADGRYYAYFDRDPMVYFGSYTMTAQRFSSYEYRGIWEGLNGQIRYAWVATSSLQSGTYRVGAMSLDTELGGTTSHMTRVFLASASAHVR
jgi:hypothetical protein